MLIGLIKWFDREKGFGVVGTPDNGEFFLHINSFSTRAENILRGMPIAFSPKIDKVKNRKSAENSRLVGNSGDWGVILSYLGKSDDVKIEIEATREGKLGNPYRYKEIQSFSLIRVSLKYFFKNKSEEEISNLIVDYFDTELESKHFILYCELFENMLPQHFLSDISSSILGKIFAHFGNNLNGEILFNIWKQKKFKFISRNEMDDYEIPESVLRANILEVGKPELSRILMFSFGSEFCSYYVNKKFDDIETCTSAEVKELYLFLEYEKETKKKIRKDQLDNLYAKKIEIELIEKINQFDTIINSVDFNNCNRLLQLIPNEFSDANKDKVTKAIHKLIVQKCSDELKMELWIQGIIEDMLFEFILKYFLNKDTQIKKRISILTRLGTEQQFELLKEYSDEYTFEKGFALLGEFVKKENSLSYCFNLLETLFDSDFWKNKKGSTLIELFTNYIKVQSNDEQKYELFLKGYVKNVPLNIVLQKTHQLEKEVCKKIFGNISENKSFIKAILAEKAALSNINSLSWLYDLAIEFLDEENFNSFDEKIFSTIEQSEYFKFWEAGKAKIFPQSQIGKILQDKFESYSQIGMWIKNNVTTAGKISDFLFSVLYKQELATDRIIFYKQLNHIKYLLQLNKLHLEQIQQIKNNFYSVILWVLDKDDCFNFELLKQKFIYFAPREQVRIIRKLFLLKAKGEFDLTIEKLNELTRFDLDLYKANLKFNPDISIDISTDVLIKVLLSYQQNQRFVISSELLTMILDDLKFNKTKRFKLSNYFEDCLGRQTATFNWSREGEIKKVKFGNNRFYFAISFPPKIMKRVNTRFGVEYVSLPNPKFESLGDAVKKITGVKWNANEKHWGVPSQYEKEVLNFAKEHRFFIDFEGSNYTNNIHLADFKRADIPNGVSFCEGRLANIPHKMFKKEFWWCGGQPCFSKCETIHKIDEWEKYTLLDFCEILGLNTDEINKMGDYIPKGHYYQFIALVNRFNRLLDKLYCHKCNHILYPSDFGTSHFAAHTIVRFQCRNEYCSNKGEIYLNHCLNGQCNCIIDSRVSKRCANGLFICENCGCCCSHKQLKTRLNNLLNTDNVDTYYKKIIINELVDKVKNKKGHLERAEFFCYKCQSQTTEIGDDVYQCPSCRVEYNTRKYKSQKGTNENIDDDLDFSF